MADHLVKFYASDPASILTTGVGSTFSWTGDGFPSGDATISDPETGIYGTTLDDDTIGEVSTADVTIGGLSSSGSYVDADMGWTVRDTETNEIFQIVAFEVQGGGAAGSYTLSEQPLVPGRTYEVLEFSSEPNVDAGDPVFTYTDYVEPDSVVTGTDGDDTIDASYVGDPEGNQIDDGAAGGASGHDNIVEGMGGDDSISSGAGDDTVYGGAGGDTVDGGDGSDTIYGDSNGPSGGSDASEFLDWSLAGADEADISSGFTQNTGAIDVTVSFSDDGDNLGTLSVETTSPGYVGSGEVFDPNSQGQLEGSGNGATSTTTINFTAAAGGGAADEVVDVSFRLSDIDVGDESFRDVVTINAYDASGNPVVVTITPDGTDTVAGNTITAAGGSENPDDASGGALIEIAGPVAWIEVIYANAGTNSQTVFVSDVHFDPVMLASDADDNLFGGAGDDLIYGEEGADTIDGGSGADSIEGGTGADSITGGLDADTIAGGAGNDIVDGGSGDDVLYGDSNGPNTGTSEFLDWSAQGSDGSDLEAGFTQNTGEMDISVSFASDGTNLPTYLVETTDTTYVDPADPFDPNSSLLLSGDGTGTTSITTIDFAAAAGGNSQDEVENISFRINDIDWEAGNHTDVLTINAFDADGNPVTVVITPEAGDAVAGNTITAEMVGENFDSLGGSALIEIAGPVHSIEIVYGNQQDGTQAVWVSDVHFDTIPVEDIGDDTLTGGSGNDVMTGGDGDDVFALADGSGHDTITDFDTGDTDADGFYNDQLDVTNLTDADGNPVNVGDVVVTDDGSGNALLTFPNGESVVLQGVTPEDMSTNSALFAAGIPCFTKGTLIQTPQGERPIESLQPNDLVTTMDNGDQPVLWIGERHLGPDELTRCPRLKPVYFAEGALGNHTPLLVSPLHGMFVRGMGGRDQALARAKHLAETQSRVRIAQGKRNVHYYHLLFETHQIIQANGTWCESLYPGPYSLAVFEPAQRAEVYRQIPKLGTCTTAQAYGETARPFLKRREVIQAQTRLSG